MKDEGEISATRLWLVLMKAHASIVSYVEKTISEKGLGFSDFMVLEVLLHKGPLTMSAVAERVLLTNPSMTSAVDRLEKKNLVSRTTQTQDRRVRMVALTESGRAFIVPIFRQHEKDLDLLMQTLPAVEKRTMHRSLKKLGLAASDAVLKSSPVASDIVRTRKVDL